MKRRKTGCLAAVSVAAGLALVPGVVGILKNDYDPVPPGTKLQQLEKRDLAARFVFDALHNVGYLCRLSPVHCQGDDCDIYSPGDRYGDFRVRFARRVREHSIDRYNVVCEFDQSRNWFGDWKHTLRKVRVVCSNAGKGRPVRETEVDSLVGENMTQEKLEEILREVRRLTK